MKPQSAKNKGRRLQKQVVADILEAFPELHPDDVTSRSMGAGGEDVLLSPKARERVPFAIECKNQESLSVWSVMKQADSHHVSYPGLLVMTRNHHPTYAVVRWEELLYLLRKASTV